MSDQDPITRTADKAGVVGAIVAAMGRPGASVRQPKVE